MQTSFTPEQLADPDIAVANDILRSCVHCGFCTATCPTFVTLGDELDSPRGRIYLMKDMLEQNRPAGAEEVLHIDRCLSCLSCMTTCPSGVHYMHLVDHARAYIEETYKRPLTDRLLRGVLAKILPYPGRMRAAMALARLGRPLAGLLPGESQLVKRLRAMLRLAPASASPAQNLGGTVHRPAGEVKHRVALLAGCAQQAIGPSINTATIALLNRLGVEVVVPAAAGCCGALVHHMGRHEEALAAARRNVAACSLQHGQQVTAPPKILLRKAGFAVVEPADAHLCCGSAGTYNIMQPEIATALRRRKLDSLLAKRPDVIAAGNIGCLTQLAGGGVPTVHVVELLDWMAGGERPAGL
jgi:glycolate oxidase iron-sulfur subunit